MKRPLQGKHPSNSKALAKNRKTAELARTDIAFGVKKTKKQLAQTPLDQQVGHSHLESVWDKVCEKYPKLLKRADPDDDRFRAVDYWFYPHGVKIAIAVTSNPLNLVERVRKVSLGMSAYSATEVPKRFFVVQKPPFTVEEIELVLMQIASEESRYQLVTLNYTRPTSDQPFTRKILNNHA